jgi:hypothetical protein
MRMNFGIGLEYIFELQWWIIAGILSAYSLYQNRKVKKS